MRTFIVLPFAISASMVIKSSMGLAGHVECTRVKRNEYKILV
jgi:hypothetical protein